MKVSILSREPKLNDHVTFFDQSRYGRVVNVFSDAGRGNVYSIWCGADLKSIDNLKSNSLQAVKIEFEVGDTVYHQIASNHHTRMATIKEIRPARAKSPAKYILDYGHGGRDDINVTDTSIVPITKGEIDTRDAAIKRRNAMYDLKAKARGLLDNTRWQTPQAKSDIAMLRGDDANSKSRTPWGHPMVPGFGFGGAYWHDVYGSYRGEARQEETVTITLSRAERLIVSEKEKKTAEEQRDKLLFAIRQIVDCVSPEDEASMKAVMEIIERVSKE